MKLPKVIRFNSKYFEKLYKMPCDSFDERKQKLIYKALEIRENLKEKKK